MENEVQNIISGKSKVKHGSFIQTILGYLARSEGTGAMDKTNKHFKVEETERLRTFVDNQNLWINTINIDNYVSEGAEQKVYLKEGTSVIKLNDAIYYLSWVDYLHNLLLNNYFFPDTAYNLLGFYLQNNDVFAVVEQQYVMANEKTNLALVKKFLENNGFQNTRNNDYFNPKLGIILEDLHDENVLTQNGILYFIDTVFYITNK